MTTSDTTLQRLPEGMIDRHEACRMFGISLATWNNWQNAGKVRCAGRLPSNPRIKLYALKDVQALFQELRGPNAVYRSQGRRYRLPDGMVGAEQACGMFGVDKAVMKRWERECRITCGVLCDGGRKKIYPIAELNRLLVECGRYAPPYPDPDHAGCWRVPLSGYDIRRREAIIDQVDLPLIEGRSCYWSDHGSENDGHVKISVIDTPLHHAIMAVDTTKWRVGHVNGNTLDCRRANLVVRTHSEKAAGMRKAKMFRGKPCTSRFKGVCWDRRKEMWLAYIKKDQVSRSLGHFDNEIDAAEARDKAAREIFGEHARLNFPDRGERGLIHDEASQTLRAAA
jgi:hypothetical protein